MRLTCIAAVIVVLLHVTAAWLFDIDSEGVPIARGSYQDHGQHSRDLEALEEPDNREPETLTLRILRQDGSDIGRASELHRPVISNLRRYALLRTGRLGDDLMTPL